MKLRHLTIALLMGIGMTAFADNTKTTVEQVTSGVTVSSDVDYIITGTTPFTTAGSVNITDTEHGVVIIKKIKPSKVISSWLSFVYINGEKAENGVNCQVRMYDRGAIIFPYAKDFKPLTCYTEKDYAGESCNNYTEGSSGGYMKSLSTTTLNNKIRSFKLKRGYMVTFALGLNGWGYSRCFIADQADLEMNMPANMDARVSSYRVFQWYNAHKAGLASNGNYAANQALNTCWCYDWAQGNSSNLPDVEWVPNHIYEDYPSSSTCGSVTGSCHMKTNNEPGNSSDDHPQTVDVILANWQNLMRTGMRLCSESSHDGSWSHFGAFIDSIDARGWRCDLLDLHCYWGSGSFNDFSGYYSKYGNRPVWISEWVWGASWNSGNWSSGGIFAQAPDGASSFSTANQQKCYDGTVPILEKLNASKYVERYAYWNSEADASKIYKDGTLSILGKYYAAMDEGLGYNAAIQKVPNVVYNTPKNFTCTYSAAKKTAALAWTDDNGDMLDSMTVEVRLPGTTRYVREATIDLKDMNASSGSSYSYTYNVGEPGAYYLRIAVYPIGKTTPKYSSIQSFTCSAALGNEDMQYGKITVTNLTAVSTTFDPSFSETPSVLMGMISNKNTTLYPANLLTSIAKAKFSYQILPWANQSNAMTTIKNAEEIPFLAIQTGVYKFGSLDVVVGREKVNKDTCQITFSQAFPEGVTPIVLTDLHNTALKTSGISINVWDVTNTGFKCMIQYEEAENKNITLLQNMNYFAITPGFSSVDSESGILIAAGMGENDVYGSSTKICTFRDEAGDTLRFKSPAVFGRCQTNNYPAAAIMRKAVDLTDDNGLIYGCRVKRQVDGTSTTKVLNSSSNPDKFGYVVIAASADGVSVPTAVNGVKNGEGTLMPRVVNGVITVAGATQFGVYDAAGRKVNAKRALPSGLYIVRAGSKTAKVMVK